MLLPPPVPFRRKRRRSCSAGCCCCIPAACLCTALVFLLIAGILLFFFVPRVPRVRLDDTGPAFAYSPIATASAGLEPFQFEFALLFDNPNYVSLGVDEVEVAVLHLRSGLPVGRVIEPRELQLQPRADDQRKVLKAEITPSASTGAAAIAMAEEYAANQTIRVQVRGAGRPQYMGFTLPRLPLVFTVNVADTPLQPPLQLPTEP